MNKNLSMIQCKECQATMHEQVQKINKQKYNPLDDKYIYYKCESCNSQVKIIKTQSITSNIISALFIGGFTFYFLFTGLFDFILYSFSHGSWWIFAGTFLIVISLFFTLGPLWMLYNVYTQIKEKLAYTLVTQDKRDY